MTVHVARFDLRVREKELQEGCLGELTQGLLMHGARQRGHVCWQVARGEDAAGSSGEVAEQMAIEGCKPGIQDGFGCLVEVHLEVVHYQEIAAPVESPDRVPQPLRHSQVWVLKRVT